MATPPLDRFPLAYIDAQTLLWVLKDYKNPRDCIARMVKNGILIRLKNGFYIIADRIQGVFSASLEQIGNLLYGPSYISLEWALSYYGLIPERATVVTSVTIGKSKEFVTPIGLFTYSHLPLFRYDIGIDRKLLSDLPGGFLIATPEKALIDLIFLKWKAFRSLSEFTESMRIESEALRQLDRKRLEKIGEVYAHRAVDKFIGSI
jgi:hypothetical protein